MGNRTPARADADARYRDYITNLVYDEVFHSINADEKLIVEQNGDIWRANNLTNLVIIPNNPVIYKNELLLTFLLSSKPPDPVTQDDEYNKYRYYNKILTYLRKEVLNNFHDRKKNLQKLENLVNDFSDNPLKEEDKVSYSPYDDLELDKISNLFPTANVTRRRLPYKRYRGGHRSKRRRSKRRFTRR